MWLAGRTDITLLEKFKRIGMFSRQDLELLRDILLPFDSFVTTPHILSETSNFLDQAPYWLRAALLQEFKNFIRQGVEVYDPAESLMERDEFNVFGLTDTALSKLSSDAVVITVDFRLAGKIASNGGHVLNFTHFRAK